jgi:hypothetical protein
MCGLPERPHVAAVTAGFNHIDGRTPTAIGSQSAFAYNDEASPNHSNQRPPLRDNRARAVHCERDLQPPGRAGCKPAALHRSSRAKRTKQQLRND